MTTGKTLKGKPYAGKPHVRFDEEEVASCTAEASLRRGPCRRQPEGCASRCAATPRRGSLLYRQTVFCATFTVALSVMFSFLVRAESVDVFALQHAEFEKYYKQITGKDAPEGIVQFAIDPKVSKSGRDAYRIISAGAKTML